ncbi:hypothetical protein BJ322DRAFT_1055161 [Thelephora terrestris]|uniref:Uncharacterized protein n=1 Tax=Thelephora terrestris TaxID=56493 RepID=A0A9P6HJS2_9AGAM|nr:hypothetical protein BJ322DRAFT_1055161 [Thelephora terrestris]
MVKKVQMAAGTFADGSPHLFYFPDGHKFAGLFKGMNVILEERGFRDQTRDLKWECPGFRCPPGRTDCCVRRTLYSQPDFQGVTFLLEEHCGKCGFDVLFLPKFHPELNFVEQCRGRAKWSYCQLPASSGEEDLEMNALKSLDLVPLPLMRRFSNRLLRFMDAYRKGLNGEQAAWAGKKYHSHRLLPPSWRKDLEAKL